MIHDHDADFHTPTSDSPTWAETNYFGFYIPEANMNVGVYALFRPNVGVVISTISINSKFVEAPWQAEYWDAQHHLAIPKPYNLRDYSLANGLSVTSVVPNKVWDVSYDNGDGVSLSFRYTALADAFDIHDPEQDPMVAAALANASADDTFAWGEAYAGHFDQTGKFEGELHLRGKKYVIDCVSTMDHSWGLRTEHQGHTMSWLHAHFSDDFAIHGIFDFDPELGLDAVTPLALEHGYVLENGQLYGLSHAEGRSIRNRGFYPHAIELEVTDSRGKSHRLTGLGRTAFPWQAGPGTVGYNVLLEWQYGGDKASGWGETMDFIGPQDVTRIYSGHARR
ncbi:DUF7064 domain-containing protein [Gordonia hydrophobica]|uniref:AttH domain-containing protein n=1 Tax=Gordonia hydrophobica TaxID=40516 RepID=A0ABZ2U6Y4_9ACTN|nr:hypothetical protein [Gordonia hydrophobica]MBM7365391.1 hypothetical protein [Gordonia hydrophobica]